MKTAECVTPKHPDKMCDQISDAILDWYMDHDPYSRVAVEVLGGHGKVFICGEVTAAAPEIYKTALEGIVRSISGKELEIECRIVQQSKEIANGVDTGGAGDQGIMVGYACNENEAMIPQELYMARSLCQFLYKKFPYDGKTQITLDDNGLVHTIVASFQSVTNRKLQNGIMKWVDEHEDKVRKGLTVHANPAGEWDQGGFDADTGLTGRKLAVDNYGPQIPIGGGCFSGKDATKVDRSAAYMARYIAVDQLKLQGKSCEWVLVKLAYAIGEPQPVMANVTVKLHGHDEKTVSILKPNNLRGVYDLTPKAIIEKFTLHRTSFEMTAKWGHFGNNFPWDK